MPVRKAIEYGAGPCAGDQERHDQYGQEIGVSHIGAVAPGYTADMVLTKDIHTMWADAVFYGGSWQTWKN